MTAEKTREGSKAPPRAPDACDECLARAWLLGRLAGHLDRARARLAALLDLADEDLIAAVGGKEKPALLADLAAFDAAAYRERCAAAAVAVLCRCDPAYPSALWSLAAEPAVLHVAGDLDRFLELVAGEPVAIVGARAAPAYGLERARSLARGLGRAGATVISGMARGVDSAAHHGALDGGAGTVAVLACAPQRPYPQRARALHRRILASGAAVSELGPDVAVRQWMFPARNRIIAALSAITVVVAAGRHSGAMLTARHARELGRALGAVPGPVTSPLSAGPHALLRAGAHLIAEPADVLAALGDGYGHPAGAAAEALLQQRRAPPGLQRLLDALGEGRDPPEAFEAAGLDAARGLAALTELELAGCIRRETGGRFTITT